MRMKHRLGWKLNLIGSNWCSSVCDADGGGGVGGLSESCGRVAGEEQRPAGAAFRAEAAAARARDAAARVAEDLRSAQDAGKFTCSRTSARPVTVESQTPKNLSEAPEVLHDPTCRSQLCLFLLVFLFNVTGSSMNVKEETSWRGATSSRFLFSAFLTTKFP